MGQNDNLKVFKTTIELGNLDVLYLTISTLREFFFTRIAMAQYATSGLVLFASFFVFLTNDDYKTV
jgi:hypothetical protein